MLAKPLPHCDCIAKPQTDFKSESSNILQFSSLKECDLCARQTLASQHLSLFASVCWTWRLEKVLFCLLVFDNLSYSDTMTKGDTEKCCLNQWTRLRVLWSVCDFVWHAVTKVTERVWVQPQRRLTIHLLKVNKIAVLLLKTWRNAIRIYTGSEKRPEIWQYLRMSVPLLLRNDLSFWAKPNDDLFFIIICDRLQREMDQFPRGYCCCFSPAI